MSNVWDSLMIVWAPPSGLGFFLCSAPVTHMACLLGFSWLHSTAAAVLGSHLMVPVSPKLGCIFTNGLCSWCRVSTSPWFLQSWAFNCHWGWTSPMACLVLHDPFMSSIPVPTWVTLTLLSLAASTRYNLGYFWDTAFVCWLSGNTSKKILPQQFWSLLKKH